MRIAICDRDEACCAQLTGIIESWQRQAEIDSVHVQSFRSSEDLLQAWRQQAPFDILFLETQFPNELNGIETARQIRETDDYVQIVFISCDLAHARDGYAVEALRFLEKPLSEALVTECLDIACRHWHMYASEKIVLNQNGAKLILQQPSILYIEIQDHDLIIHRADSAQLHVIRFTIRQMLELLSPELFVQCHRSYAVNIAYVRGLSPDAVTLADGSVIPVGGKFYEAINQLFDKYYQQ